jgi:diguanylate cyclase (GGDEF)-like protein
MRSLKTKLVFYFLLVILIPVLLITFIVIRKIENQYFASMDARLKYTLEGIKKEYGLIQEEALSLAKSYASMKHIKELVKKEDRLALRDEFIGLKAGTDLDIIELGNRKGIVLIRAHMLNKFGGDKSTDFQIKEALAGKTTVDVRKGEFGLVISAAVPLRNDGKIIGTVRTGYILNSIFVDRIKMMNDMEISLYAKDKLIATTLMDRQKNRRKSLPIKKEFLEPVLKKGEERFFSLNIDSFSYSLGAFPLLTEKGEVVGILLGGLSNEAVLKMIARTRRYIFLIALFGGLLAAFLGFVIAGNITEPVKKLMETTKRVASGDLNQEVHINSSDEIGALANSFNRMTKDLERLHRQTENLANTDALSGLYNYRYFYEQLEREIKEAQEYHYPLSLIVLDVDYFKKYNDTYGHLEGDMILKELGEVLKESIRKTDVAARYGGDEFMVVLPRMERKEAIRFAERMRIKVKERPFPKEEAQPLGDITISLGIAVYPEDAGTTEELVKKADRAMYTAKNTGRNRVSS